MNRKAHKSKWQLGWLKKNENIFHKIIKPIVKSCLKKIKKPSRETAVPHHAKGLKGALGDNKAIAEKLSDFFAQVFTAEGV